MAVFTIFCHGTGERRGNENQQELIHALSNKAAGAEYEDFLILDGPGVGDDANPMAGTFDAFDRAKGAKGKAPKYSRTDMKIMDVGNWEEGGSAKTWNPSAVKMIASGIGNVFQGGAKGVLAGTVGALLSPLAVPLGAVALKSNDHLRGLIHGEGMDDNIRHAMAALGNKWQDFNGQTVNMIGWSRGAITCIRMANWLQEFYGKGMIVNIFAVDPVAGSELGLQVTDTYTIPSIVKNFVGVLVMDEKRGGFLPQDINRLQVEDTSETKMALLPFPGRHDTPVKLHDQEYAEVTATSRYLAYKFLTECGSRFKSTEPMLASVFLSDMYASMKSKLEGYEKMGKKDWKNAAQGGIAKRDVASQLDRYVSHNTAFFVNEHHVECFKAAFPRIYQLFFSASPGLPSGASGAPGKNAPPFSELSDVGRMLKQFYQSNECSAKLLISLGVLSRRSSGVLGTGPVMWTVKPCGLYTGDNGAMIRGRPLLRKLMG